MLAEGHENDTTTTKLTIVNTTSRSFDDSNRRSIRSHAASFGRRQQKQAWAKKKHVAKAPTRLLAEKGHALPPISPFGNSLDPFLSLPQSIVELNHGGTLNKIKAHMFSVFRQSASHRVILPQAIRHPTFFTSMLLLAYSHYDAMTSSRPSPEAMSIKIESIRQINEQLRNPETAATPENISAITCLAGATTVSAYEMDALWDYKVHRNAIAMLVDLAGGAQALKQSELGWALLKMLVLRDQVEVATWSAPYRDFPESLLEPKPPFAATSQRSSIVWKSPLYEPPLQQGQTRPDTDRLPLTMRLVLINIRALMMLLERERHGGLDDRSQLQSCREQIHRALLMAPAIGQMSLRNRSEQDYMYECCRLTAIIMLKADKDSCTLRAATEGTTILSDLHRALQHTDIPSLWGEHIGILFWVILVANAAAFHTPFHLFTTSVLTNLMFEACYSEYDLKVALKPVRKMIWFEHYCKVG